jgi:hypothetical protein
MGITTADAAPYGFPGTLLGDPSPASGSRAVGPATPNISMQGRQPLAASSLLGAASDAHSPWCGAEALDQKIDEGAHLGSLMTARRQQRI